jgi:hypothetical protein
MSILKKSEFQLLQVLSALKETMGSKERGMKMKHLQGVAPPIVGFGDMPEVSHGMARAPVVVNRVYQVQKRLVKRNAVHFAFSSTKNCITSAMH